MPKHLRYLIVLLSALPLVTHAGEVRVAVAANFLSTAQVLAQRFQTKHQDRVLLSVGSTGKLYAQIVHGAPYDIMLAADVRRPALLDRGGLAIKGSRFTYAVGQLVLWSRNPALVDAKGAVLRGNSIHRLAIANPKTAPYGAAAQEVLQRLHLWASYRGRIVRGENVGQTFQFVATGNADAGFVALSQVLSRKPAERGSRWQLPTSLYRPIEQQAVLLKRAENNAAATAFIEFLRSPTGHAIIERHGYSIP